MKRVSIIVPVYNVADYLQECLESILQQNFSNYEIICVDDASTDNSRDILDIYAKNYNIIHVIKHKKNMGLSAARNTGLRCAIGKYIWFVDSDDKISEGSLKELYDIAERNRTDILCFGLRVVYKESYKKLNLDTYNIQKDEKVCSGKELFCDLVDKGTWSASVCRKFIKRDFLIENQIKFYEGILHEDVLFSFYCIIQAERVINTEKVYYICHQRETSITAQKTHKSAESNFVIMVQLIIYWYTHTFTERENSAMKAYIYDRYNMYLHYDRFGIRSKELEVGGYVEKALYDILYNKKSDKRVKFNKTQLEHIKNIKNVLVFGASYYAADIVDVLKENGIKVNIIAVSNMDFNPTVFCGIPVDTIEHISEYIKNDVVFVIGVSLKNCADIKHQLESLGYKDIVIPEYKRSSNNKE